jgi:hypothetical protein
MASRARILDLGNRINQWKQDNYNLRMTWSLSADTVELLERTFPETAKHLNAGLVKGKEKEQKLLLQGLMVSRHSPR